MITDNGLVLWPTALSADGFGRGAWPRLVLLKAAKIRAQAYADDSSYEDEEQVEGLLELATAAAQKSSSIRGYRDRLRRWWTGEDCDQAWRIIHEAEARSIALLPPEQMKARVAELAFDARDVLDREDPLLAQVLVQGSPGTTPKPGEEQGESALSPDKVREFVRRYRSAWDDRYVRSRNYRNRLRLFILIVTIFVTVLVTVGGLSLFSIEKGASSGQNLVLNWPYWNPSVRHLVAMIAIGTLGSIGGLLAGTRQVVQVGGVYNPFNLPLHSLILKVQMGALNALAGVLAILGGLAPGVTINQWGDIAVWALALGATQQLLTTLVDRKVEALVTSSPRPQTERT